MSESAPQSSNSFEEDYGNPQFLRLVEEIWPHLDSKQGADYPANDSTSTVPDSWKADETGTAVLIGRFEILRELGRGGEGVVLLAFDPHLRRRVAMKVLRPEGLLSPRLRQRFLSEARAVAALRHPNIVTIHEAGEAGPIPYIIMEYCEGVSLSDWLARRTSDQPVSERWAARLVAQIADGIQHAHDHGILHRDLKPSNILFQGSSRDPLAEHNPGLPGGDDKPDYTPLVTDFGLAKSVDATRLGLEQTLEGLALGTIPYMASEAARGDLRAIGFATDIYGLGIILFELLTGRRPFQGINVGELLEQIQNAEPPSPRSLRSDLPNEIERICLRCLQKNPSDRYQRPSALAGDLRRYLDSVADPDLPQFDIKAKPRSSPHGRLKSRIAVRCLVVLSLFTLASLVSWSIRVNSQDAIDGLLHQLESAEPAGLGGLVPKIDPAVPTVARRLAQMYSEGTPNQKLAAALVLAGDRSEFGEYCYEQLLQINPEELMPIARILHRRIPDLPARLRTEIARLPPQGSANELQDRRCARAACVLIGLGQGEEGWRMLRFAPNPQARSFLIHELGPSGITPTEIVDRLAQEGDPSSRLALIQSLGEVPGFAWSAGAGGRLRKILFDLYQNDLDPGVHGSCKWLLRRWNLEKEMRNLDTQLSRSTPSADRRWRVSPMGLTLVRIHNPKSRRDIEVADTEVTVELFRKFQQEHLCKTINNPEPSHPVTCMNFMLASRFCNWLSQQEGFASDEMAYRCERDVSAELVEDQRERTGYRMLDTWEYELACRAGTISSRSYGSSDSLLPRYAWCGQPLELLMRPVAKLKPNDIGLFDMLGNADELCHDSRATRRSEGQAAVCGGSVLYDVSSMRSGLKRGPISVTEDDAISWAFGFRVARTVRTIK